MKNAFQICMRFILIAGFTTQVSAQENSTPERSRPLVLTEAIPLPGVQGRSIILVLIEKTSCSLPRWATIQSK